MANTELIHNEGFKDFQYPSEIKQFKELTQYNISTH
jgi:hypothetical protein